MNKQCSKQSPHLAMKQVLSTKSQILYDKLWFLVPGEQRSKDTPDHYQVNLVQRSIKGLIQG